MKILILGAGKMGSFFCDLLSFDHDVAIYDNDPKRLRFSYHCRRFTSEDEICSFAPDMVINAVALNRTLEAFRFVSPLIPENCIISDIASVKTGLPEFYHEAGRRFVSTHPMFGPTFASLSNLKDENAIIISESDPVGKIFFLDLYRRLKLNIVEYSFEKHDKTIAYSLSIPFASSLVFGSVMKYQEAPGTTFKRHLKIAKGLMSEDDYLLTEILMNPHTPHQLEKIREKLSDLQNIIELHDKEALRKFLKEVRENLKQK